MNGNNGDKNLVLNDFEEESVNPMRTFKGYKDKIVSIIAISISVFPIIHITHILDNFGMFIPSVSYLSLILACILILGFLLLPMKKGESKDKLPWYDALFIFLSIIAPIYNFFTWGENTYRYIYSDFYAFEIGLGILTVLGVLEITRRAIGLAMPLVTTIFLIHMFLGFKLTGFLKSPQIALSNGIANLVYFDTGIFGVAFEVAAGIVILFLIFSQFMVLLGGTNFLFDIALSLFGHVRGGPAKVSVVASAFMGMFSGSTTANIASTGVFTIPMMKRIGYKSEFAAAVEAVASNGGQLMPPIMGMVAFVMAQWLGIPYGEIALMAIIPSLLYFLALFIIIDFRAIEKNILGIPKKDCPSFSKTIKEGGFYFLPILTLIYFIVILKISPEISILYSLVSLFLAKGVQLIFNVINKKDDLSCLYIINDAFKLTVNVFKRAGILLITPAIATACCGIIIGTLSVSQLGLGLTSFAIKIASHHVMLLLLMSAFTCFILGMGMSSLPAYIMTVIIVVPALVEFGVPPLATHFFVFWFSIASFITPPVAVGAYVAAAIANANPLKTGIEAMRLGFIEFILPFVFIFSPAILLQGTMEEIIYTVIFTFLGVSSLAIGLGSYFLTKLKYLQKLMFILGGGFLIATNFELRVCGLLLTLLVVVWQIKSKGVNKTQTQ